MSISRRTFVEAAAGTAALASTALPPIVLADEAIEPTETVECDICVVGSGISGLAAAVQAAELGASVIVLEAAPVPGGNGNGVEGSFGANSPLQKEQGIEFGVAQLVGNELKATQYRVDGRLWKDLYNNSGDNIAWLIENGVEFSGEVNDYGTGAGIVSMHWYKDGKAGVGYVPAMVAKAQELGATFMFDTRAERPVLEDGAVMGVYAQGADEQWIEVRAKATILASGGFGADPALVSRIGYPPENIWYYGVPTARGDGLRIALEAGAKDFSYMAADNAHAYIKALPHEGPVDMPNCMMSMAPCMIWVNQDGERFCREDCASSNFCLQNPPRWNQKQWFFVFDSVIYDTVCDMVGVPLDKGHEILDAAVETNEEQTLFRGDSFAEIAEAVGIDPEALTAEMEKYNQFCAAGVDEDWCKEIGLVAMGEPPYYIARPHTLFLMSIGGIATDANGQAVTDAGDPIPGLYAVGVDGCMLYRNV